MVIKIIDKVVQIGFCTLTIVENDVNSTTITFKTDRYYDNVDLSTYSGRINFLNQAGEADFYSIAKKNIRINTDSTIEFDWKLDHRVTKYQGVVKFSIILESSLSTESPYRWITKTAMFTVLGGVNVNNYIESQYPIFLEQWLKQMNDLYVATEKALENCKKEVATATAKATIATTSAAEALSHKNSAATIAKDTVGTEVFKKKDANQIASSPTKSYKINNHRALDNTGEGLISNLVIKGNTMEVGI